MMRHARRLARMFAVAGAIVTAGVFMLAAPALADAGVPVVSEIPGGTTPLVVLGSGLATTLAALVYMVRSIANGKLVPSHTAEREERYLGLLAESSQRESKLTEMVDRARQREESYSRLIEQQAQRGRQ